MDDPKNAWRSNAKTLIDGLTWEATRRAVDLVRYRPRQVDLMLACGVGQSDLPAPLLRWLVDARAEPALRDVAEAPHRLVTVVAAVATRFLGPVASTWIRWSSGAVAATADLVGASTLHHALGDRAHPGMLVPHPHQVAVLALDMRGFSHLTRVLHDTQYLADLIGEYLTELTAVVEAHRGVVFQYTGDGLLAIFLPELAGGDAAAMLDRVVHETARELHEAFDRLHARWRADWRASGREGAAIGLGIGVSFGRATVGFLGPSGKKQFGVLGEPVNQAAYLCSQASAGTLLVEREAFTRAHAPAPAERVIRMRSKKRHQRIEIVSFRYGEPPAARRRWRDAIKG